MPGMKKCACTLPPGGQCHHLYTLRCRSVLHLDWGEKKITPKQGSLIASAVLSACYVTLQANVAQRTHTGGEALCWATATISCQRCRFRETENRGRSEIDNRWRTLLLHKNSAKQGFLKRMEEGLRSLHPIQARICSSVGLWCKYCGCID